MVEVVEMVVVARKTEDGTLKKADASEAQTRADADTSITAALVTETDARKTEDGTLEKADASEAQTRADADTSIAAALFTETDVRKTEDGSARRWWREVPPRPNATHDAVEKTLRDGDFCDTPCTVP